MLAHSHSNHQKKIKGLEQEVGILNDSRYKCVDLNIKYNKLYQGVMTLYYRGDSRFESAAYVLQELAPEMHGVNDALKLDCASYDEKTGQPLVSESGDTVKILPEVVRVRLSN